jgi:hypothetical protein
LEGLCGGTVVGTDGFVFGGVEQYGCASDWSVGRMIRALFWSDVSSAEEDELLLILLTGVVVDFGFVHEHV